MSPGTVYDYNRDLKHLYPDTYGCLLSTGMKIGHWQNSKFFMVYIFDNHYAYLSNSWGSLGKLSWTTASYVNAEDVYAGELAGALQGN